MSFLSSLFGTISSMFSTKPTTPAGTPATPEQTPEQTPAQEPTTSNPQIGPVSDAGLALVKQFEGCRLVAYQDIVGVWTIGYGHTQGVYQGMTITQAQADQWLGVEYSQFEAKVKALVKVPVTQNQLGALTCFAYNVGIGNLSSSTLLKLLNSGANAQTVAAQFARWNQAGGKVLAGLVARRAAEANLFLTPDPI
jgi:lysozyme